MLTTLPACRHTQPSPRTLHYVGDDLVTTKPADPRAYAAYLQAQLALAQDPPDLPHAAEQLALALHYDRGDAHLWTVRGEVLLRQGDIDGARQASARALALRPDYPPAAALQARLDGAGPARQQVVTHRR